MRRSWHGRKTPSGGTLRDGAQVAHPPNWHSSSLGLVGVGATAVALQHEPGVAFDALVWLGSDGIVRNSHQIDLPSALLQVGSIGGRSGGCSGTWCTATSVAGCGVSFSGAAMSAPVPRCRWPTEPVRTLQVISPGDGSHDLAIGFLPVGGRDPELTTRPGVEWTSGELGDWAAWRSSPSVLRADRHEGNAHPDRQSLW